MRHDVPKCCVQGKNYANDVSSYGRDTPKHQFIRVAPGHAGSVVCFE